ncbi:MAG: DUF4382 domain-containing protein, partial [Rhodothermales bacterium]
MKPIDRIFRRVSITPLIALFVAASLGLAACDGVIGPQNDGKAQLSVRMIDAPFPFDLVASTNVTITRVEVVGEESGPITISEDETTYNLLDLRDGVSALLGDVELDPDTYSAVHLYVQDASIELNDGTTFDLKVPSNRIKVLTNSMTLADGDDVTLTIDFDVSRSFVVQGNVNTPAGIKGFLFKPVVVPAKVERRNQDSDDMEIEAVIEEVTDEYVVIGGIQYWFTDETEFDDVAKASLEAGMLVEIEFVEGEDGTFFITKIELEEADEDEDEDDTDDEED